MPNKVPKGTPQYGWSPSTWSGQSESSVMEKHAPKIIGGAAVGGFVHGLLRSRIAKRKVAKKIPILGMIYTGTNTYKEKQNGSD